MAGPVSPKPGIDTYVGAEPVNRFDPRGTCWAVAGSAGDQTYETQLYPDESPIGFVCVDIIDPRGDCEPQDPVGGTPFPTLLPHFSIVGFRSALNALDTQERAEALVNPEAAKIALNNASTLSQNLGVGTVTPLPDGTTAFSVTYKGAITDGTQITVNSAVFIDPSTPIPGFVGHPEVRYHNMLEVVATEFNLKPLTTEQFQAIFLLRELGHVMNGFGDDRDNKDAAAANTRTVISKCFPCLLRN